MNRFFKDSGMENSTFGGEPPKGSPPKNPEEKPHNPFKAQTDSSGQSKDHQAKESIPPLAPIADDEADESPPAYKKRYMPPERKIDYTDDLEPPPPEEVQEPHDVRSDPEFQQQASRRRERRRLQNLVEGPCSLRPESPHHNPPVEPEPYPDPETRQQADNAANPGEQAANAANPEQQMANADEPEEQVTPASCCSWEKCVSYYKRIRSFSFQFPFHTLMLTWPLTTAVMGALNLNSCDVNHYLPYVMMFVGLVSFLTIFFRLYLMYYEKRFSSTRTENFWLGIRASESIIWIFFAVQLYFFFEQAPSFEPEDERYCKPKLYIINLGLMCITSAAMIGWIVVNTGKLICWLRNRNERPTPLIQ